MKLLFLFLALSGLARGEEWNAATDVISDKYDAGPYLIYDCRDQHWVCVLKEFHDDCAIKRYWDNKNDRIRQRCAPIGKFLTKKSCFQRQLFMTTKNFGQTMCTKDSWKIREVDF